MPAESRENPLLKIGNSDAFFREKYLTKNRRSSFGSGLSNRGSSIPVGKGISKGNSVPFVWGVQRG